MCLLGAGVSLRMVTAKENSRQLQYVASLTVAVRWMDGWMDAHYGPWA